MHGHVVPEYTSVDAVLKWNRPPTHFHLHDLLSAESLIVWPLQVSCVGKIPNMFCGYTSDKSAGFLAALMQMSACQRYTRPACVPQLLGIINHIFRIQKFDVVKLMSTVLDSQASTACSVATLFTYFVPKQLHVKIFLGSHILVSNPSRPTCIVHKSFCPCKQCGLKSCTTTRRWQEDLGPKSQSAQAIKNRIDVFFSFLVAEHKTLA